MSFCSPSQVNGRVSSDTDCSAEVMDNPDREKAGKNFNIICKNKLGQPSNWVTITDYGNIITTFFKKVIKFSTRTAKKSQMFM